MYETMDLMLLGISIICLLLHNPNAACAALDICLSACQLSTHSDKATTSNCLIMRLHQAHLTVRLHPGWILFPMQLACQDKAKERLCSKVLCCSSSSNINIKPWLCFAADPTAMVKSLWACNKGGVRVADRIMVWEVRGTICDHPFYSLMINSCAERPLSLTHSIKASEPWILQSERGYRVMLDDLPAKASLIYE